MKERAATGAEKRSSDVIDAQKKKKKGRKERSHEGKKVGRRKQPPDESKRKDATGETTTYVQLLYIEYDVFALVKKSDELASQAITSAFILPTSLRSCFAF